MDGLELQKYRDGGARLKGMIRWAGGAKIAREEARDGGAGSKGMISGVLCRGV